MSKKNENINEEVKNAEETAEDIKDTETKDAFWRYLWPFCHSNHSRFGSGQREAGVLAGLFYRDRYVSAQSEAFAWLAVYS